MCLATQSCPTLYDPIAHQAPLSMGILQARILEWVAMPSSMGSSQPRDRIQVSQIAGRVFMVWATSKTQEYWRGCLLAVFFGGGGGGAAGAGNVRERERECVYYRIITKNFKTTQWKWKLFLTLPSPTTLGLTTANSWYTSFQIFMQTYF